MAEEEKKKPQGPLGRLKELATDKEEQLELLSVLVRIVVLFWSGAILSLNYVTIPNYEKDKIDPTFIVPSPLFLAVAIPKVARTPVKTEAMKVGSILSFS